MHFSWHGVIHLNPSALNQSVRHLQIPHHFLSNYIKKLSLCVINYFLSTEFGPIKIISSFTLLFICSTLSEASKRVVPVKSETYELYSLHPHEILLLCF